MREGDDVRELRGRVSRFAEMCSLCEVTTSPAHCEAASERRSYG